MRFLGVLLIFSLSVFAVHSQEKQNCFPVGTHYGDQILIGPSVNGQVCLPVLDPQFRFEVGFARNGSRLLTKTVLSGKINQVLRVQDSPDILGLSYEILIKPVEFKGETGEGVFELQIVSKTKEGNRILKASTNNLRAAESLKLSVDDGSGVELFRVELELTQIDSHGKF